MRTVKSLGIEKVQSRIYGDALDEAYNRSSSLALVGSLNMVCNLYDLAVTHSY
jgi:hypothetical protein